MAAPQVLLSACAAALFAVGVANPKCISNGKYFQDALFIFSCDGSRGSYESNLVKVSAPASQKKLLAEIPAGISGFKALLRGSTDGDLQLVDPATGTIVAKNSLSDNGGGSYSGAYEGQTINFMGSDGIPTLETLEMVGPSTKPLQLHLQNNAVKAVYELGFYYDAWPAGTACPMRKAAQGCEEFNALRTRYNGLQFSKWLKSTYQSGSEAWSSVFVPETEDTAYVPYYTWPDAYKQFPGKEWDSAGTWSMYKFITHGGFETGAQNVHMEQIEWVYKLQDIQSFQNAACAKMRMYYTDPDDAWSKLAATGQNPAVAFWSMCEGMTEAELQGALVPSRTDFFNYLNADGSRSLGVDDLAPCYPNGPVKVTPPPPTPPPTPAPIPITYAPVAAPSPEEPAPSPYMEPTPAPPVAIPPEYEEPTPAPLPVAIPPEYEEPAPSPTPPAPVEYEEPAPEVLPPVNPGSASLTLPPVNANRAPPPQFPSNLEADASGKKKVDWTAIGIGTGVALAAAGVATGIGVGVAQHNHESKKKGVVVQKCAPHAKLCKDGKYVVRDPDNGCKFYPCTAENEAAAGPQFRQAQGGDVMFRQGEGQSSLDGSSNEASSNPFTSSSEWKSDSGGNNEEFFMILLGAMLLFCFVAAIFACVLSRNKKTRRSTLGAGREAYDTSRSEEGMPFMYPGHTGIQPQMNVWPQPQATYTQGGYSMDPTPGFSAPDYAQQGAYGMQPGTQYHEQNAFTVY